MKRILNILSPNKKFVIQSAIIGICGFLIAIVNIAYNINPYLIGILLVAMRFGNIYTFIITAVAAISGAFIRSVSYGVTLSMVFSLFVLFLSLPKLKKCPYKLLLPLLLLYFFISPYYLLKAFNSATIRVIASSLIIDLILMFYLENSKNVPLVKGIVYLLLPGIFITIPFLFTTSVFISLLYLQYQSKTELRLSLLLVSIVLNYFYYLLPLEEILYLAVPGVIASLFPKKKIRTIVFITIVLVSCISKYPTTFFRTTDFYLPIFSLLVFLLLPLDKRVFKLEQNENGQLIERIKNVEEYISFIGQSSPIPTLDKQNIEENLKIKSCKTCMKKDNCQNISRLSNNLPALIFTDLKSEVLRYCPNGSKLIYRYKIVRDMVDQEIKNNMVEQEKFDALQGIIQPLKTMCEPDFIAIDAETFNIALAENLVEKYTAAEILSREPLKQSEIKIVENIAQKKLSSSYRFSLIDHLYSYPFLTDLKKHFAIDFATRGFTQTNGDTYTFFQKDGNFEFALLDAMGHFESASQYSFFAKRLLELGRIHNRNITERIKELNNVLLYQNSTENYVTADILVSDKQSRKYNLLKFGSAPTYFYHAGKIEMFENKSLPLGIVPSIGKEKNELFFTPGDILVLMTDGLDKTTMKDVKQIIDNNMTAQNYLDEYKEKHGLTDDASIAIITYN